MVEEKTYTISEDKIPYYEIIGNEGRVLVKLADEKQLVIKITYDALPFVIKRLQEIYHAIKK